MCYFQEYFGRLNNTRYIECFERSEWADLKIKHLFVCSLKYYTIYEMFCQFDCFPINYSRYISKTDLLHSLDSSK